MVNSVFTFCSLLRTFLKYFSPCFSRTQFLAFSIMIHGLFLEFKRTSLFKIQEKIPVVKYQNLQYSVSESKWHPEEVNHHRIKLIEGQNTTKSTSCGVTIIDDTGCVKLHSEKTEGCKFQYCPPLKREEKCNIVVSSAFASEKKKFPINIKPYKPEDEFPDGKDNPLFKDKIKLAMELIEGIIAMAISFKAIVVDSWYPSVKLIRFVVARGLTLISEVKSNRNLRFRDPKTRKYRWVKRDELVKLIHDFFWHKLRPVRVSTKKGKSKTLMTYTFKTKFKDLDIPIKCVVVFGRWNTGNPEVLYILFSTKTNLSYKEVVRLYGLRFSIEHIFRELKDFFQFDHYQFRHLKVIERYWHLSLVAWTASYWAVQNGYFSKILKEPPKTIAEGKRAFASLFSSINADWVSKHLKDFKEQYLKIKAEKYLNVA